MYWTVLSKKGSPYSKSGMINLHASLIRYIQNPLFNRTCDLMNNAVFLPANKVFTGRMRDNKGKGLDVSKPRDSIEQDDMNKLFDQYFKPRVQTTNTQVLVHKVFFDIVYTGRRANEGLRELNKGSFDVKVGSDGLEYIEINFNEKSKKNQGSDNSTAKRALHNDHHIISELSGNILCPVKLFKSYVALLNHKEPAFFQKPNKNLDGFCNLAIGKNTLGFFMKEISKAAKLSKEYTNHCIRKMTATSMKRSGLDLSEIRNVTKHKNLDSLKHYIGGPSYQEKRTYNDAMANYAIHSPKKTRQELFPIPKEAPALKTPMANVENVAPENCLVPMYEDSQGSTSTKGSEVQPVKTQQNVVNQLRNASHLFQNANFTNCNFTLAMPK